VGSFVHDSFCGDGGAAVAGVGTVLNEPAPPGEPPARATPVFALRYSRTAGGGRLLALADEDGCVSLLDTNKRLPQVRVQCRAHW
jgi:hypothetical protein